MQMKPTKGVAALNGPRLSHVRVVDRALTKRLMRMGYEIVPINPANVAVDGTDQDFVEGAEASMLTDVDVSNAVEVAKVAAGPFRSYFEDEHGRAVVEAIARFLVLGEVPPGADLAAADASAEAGR